LKLHLSVYTGSHETGDLQALLLSRDPDVIRAAILAALGKVDEAEVSPEGLQAVFMGPLRKQS
jgi:hypothetical protein